MEQFVNNSKDVKKEYKTGTRCNICTGCGLCWGERKDIHVLTNMSTENKSLLQGERAACFENEKHSSKAKQSNYVITADIGTTTIAMQLYGADGTLLDTFAAVNPQKEYGADVLSRIQAAENPADAKRMRDMVHDVLRQGIIQFHAQMKQAKIKADAFRNAEIEGVQMVIAANTTMVYLLMGYDTAELGKAPFHANYLKPIDTVIEGIPCYILPGLSAFVGGDIMAGILACGMHENDNITLLIDLGTNGELVLGNRDKMVACATAAGPAFEGGVNCGVWGADMVSILARLRREELLDETGLLAEEFFEEGIRISNVHVTQEAIRAIQLAKGAIAAGIQIMVQEYGITMAQIDRVVLAGGFGYYLSAPDAAEIGLLPRELVDKTIAGGNTALAGALYIAGKRVLSEEELSAEIFNRIVSQANIINLAEIKTFYDIYFSSMNLI